MLSNIGGNEQCILRKYIFYVKQFPTLSKDEEFELIEKWQSLGDQIAVNQLIKSFLKLVVKVAFSFKGYGLSLMDLIMEGNLGLMKAANKFNLKLNFRFSTYAFWWVKAQIRAFILRSWSMVNVCSERAKRKLFFGLQNAKRKIISASRYDEEGIAIERDSSNYLTSDEIDEIAKSYNVTPKDVIEVDRFISERDVSLDNMVIENSTGQLAPISSGQDEVFCANESMNIKIDLLNKALDSLDERSRDILIQRNKEEKDTLSYLATKYGISCERVRQIYQNALKKVRSHVEQGVKLYQL